MTRKENSNRDARVLVAGHNGMVGSALVRTLKRRGYENLLLVSREEMDLTSQSQVHKYFEANKIDQVYVAAAKVGGIYANNTFPAEFIYENLMIVTNLVHEAWQSGVEKLLVLGSSCIYPKMSEQPIVESALLTGKIEPTNEPYGIAKIAGIKLCESYRRQYGADYRSVMPTNLYGCGDNYHPKNSHVIPALIRRFHESRVNNTETVSIWGSGKQKREFLYVDDMAEACVHIMELSKEAYESCTEPMQGHINIGFGEDIKISTLVDIIKAETGYSGTVEYDTSKPDGPPRKFLNSSCIKNQGWEPSITLEEGIGLAYQEFLSLHDN